MFLPFRWLGVIIYGLFVFIVVVLLLSILIAQFNHSFEEQQERAAIAVALTRLRLLQNVNAHLPTSVLKVCVMLRIIH